MKLPSAVTVAGCVTDFHNCPGLQRNLLIYCKGNLQDMSGEFSSLAERCRWTCGCHGRHDLFGRGVPMLVCRNRYVSTHGCCRTTVARLYASCAPPEKPVKKKPRLRWHGDSQRLCHVSLPTCSFPIIFFSRSLKGSRLGGRIFRVGLRRMAMMGCGQWDTRPASVMRSASAHIVGSQTSQTGESGEFGATLRDLWMWQMWNLGNMKMVNLGALSFELDSTALRFTTLPHWNSQFLWGSPQSRAQSEGWASKHFHPTVWEWRHGTHIVWMDLLGHKAYGLWTAVLRVPRKQLFADASFGMCQLEDMQLNP